LVSHDQQFYLPFLTRKTIDYLGSVKYIKYRMKKYAEVV